MCLEITNAETYADGCRSREWIWCPSKPSTGDKNEDGRSCPQYERQDLQKQCPKHGYAPRALYESSYVDVGDENICPQTPMRKYMGGASGEETIQEVIDLVDRHIPRAEDGEKEIVKENISDGEKLAIGSDDEGGLGSNRGL